MAFRIAVGDSAVVITLTGWDRLANLRREINLPLELVTSTQVVGRDELESKIDARVLGIGDNNGARRPGRRRVGRMMGRDAIGEQFWSVGKSPANAPLLVLDFKQGAPFARAVLQVDDPSGVRSVVDAAIDREST